MSRLRSELLALLRCPVTGGRLRQDGEELISDQATSTGDFPRYPLQDGIAILLPPDHHPIATDENESR